LFPALALALAVARAAAPLPALGVDPAQTTVSGLSSGAYMAEQFGVAHSATVAGVAMVAGGPYYCAGEPDDVPPLWNAFSRCMNPLHALLAPPDAALLWTQTQQFATAGLIDPVDNIRHQRVYVFSGALDQLVTTEVADQARRYYELAQATAITYVNHLNAGHGMITNRTADSACGANLPPYFNNCHRDLAAQLLAALYGPLVPARATAAGQLLSFDQRPFAPPGSGLADEGFLFVPTACRHGACRVHVAFHGCYQSVATVGDHFYRHAGYNEVAARNRIVVLYPQVDATLSPYNPLACWDYWGYTGTGFYTRAAPQIAAVQAMLNRLQENTQ
jgi:poly(3-hydroxybutyrate) depolymerase